MDFDENSSKVLYIDNGEITPYGQRRVVCTKGNYNSQSEISRDWIVNENTDQRGIEATIEEIKRIK